MMAIAMTGGDTVHILPEPKIAQPAPRAARRRGRTARASEIPPVFLIGAQKGGSSFLHNILVSNAPFRPAFVKEPHYFTSDRRSLPFEAHFPAREGAHRFLDSSTSYLHNPDCAERILQYFGVECRILATLRAPEARILSAYRHLVKHGCETRPLGEVLALEGRDYAALRAEELDRARTAHRANRIALRRSRTPPRDMGDLRHDEPFWNFCYVSNSFYAEQLEPFRRRFVAVAAIDLPDLANDPIGTAGAVLRFLGERVPPSLDWTLDRNETRLRPLRAAREYLANRRAEGPIRFGDCLRAGHFLWPGAGAADFDLAEEYPWQAAAARSYLSPFGLGQAA